MKIEQEIRALNSSAEIIESFVNYAVCCFPEDRNETVKTVWPKNHIEKKYFFILLLDVIAGVNIEMIPDKEDEDNLITILHKVAISPELGKAASSTQNLKIATEKFLTWLETEFEYDLYSENIGKEVKIRLKRKDALYLIGNRCKHSLLRSNSILRKLVKIYKNSGVEINPGTESLILNDIDNWFLDDFGGYHFTKICELCANVHHGIIDYVKPIMEQRVIQSADIYYSYNVPSSLTKDESIFEFYELLNRARSPFIPRIEPWEHLEGKY